MTVITATKENTDAVYKVDGRLVKRPVVAWESLISQERSQLVGWVSSPFAMVQAHNLPGFLGYSTELSNGPAVGWLKIAEGAEPKKSVVRRSRRNKPDQITNLWLDLAVLLRDAPQGMSELHRVFPADFYRAGHCVDLFKGLRGCLNDNSIPRETEAWITYMTQEKGLIPKLKAVRNDFAACTTHIHRLRAWCDFANPGWEKSHRDLDKAIRALEEDAVNRGTLTSMSIIIDNLEIEVQMVRETLNSGKPNPAMVH